VKIVFQLQHHS